MSKSELIRSAARELRALVLAGLSDSEKAQITPSRLVQLTARHLDIELVACGPDATVLRGAKAVQSDYQVAYDQTIADGYREYCILHEIGHFILHRTSERTACESSDFENPLSEADFGNDPSFGYGPKMMKEREANLFALEFLLPTDNLSSAYFSPDGKSYSSLYEELQAKSGQSESFLISQLSRAVLLRPPSEREEQTEPPRINPPNESQRKASEIEKGPLLLVAGPGTGKTKTLIERIIFLLKNGHDPSSILTLTFSTKATEEIQNRVESFNKEAAMKISIYNFHGFALELLRKYWQEAGLDQSPKIVSRLDAVLHLEKEYEKFQFTTLENLLDPLKPLVDSLNLISRLQDELVSADDLEQMIVLEESELDQSSEESEEDLSIRKKLLAEQREALEVYRIYSEFLNETKSLDYGEMIYRCVRLLRENPEVLNAVRSKYRNILVDEFQDVNRASGVLLKLIAGDGEGLWAVGDIRQSIYRWRGASPENIQAFDNEYPDASRLHLEENYRSSKQIVDLFSNFASKMRVGFGEERIGWKAASEMPAEIKYRTYPDQETEFQSIAEIINHNLSKGMRFSDHAVIARTKAPLLKISKSLEQAGIPVLYLGEIFEREEIRDLLSLLDVRGSLEGNGLIRVSQFPEFGIPKDDLKLIFVTVNSEDNNFQQFIDSDLLPEGMSEAGIEGLKKLRELLSRNPRSLSAYEYLGRILFKEGFVLSPRLMNFDQVRTPQELLAIYQLLSLTKSVEQTFREFGDEQIEKFLTHLRILLALKEDRDLSKIPDALSNFDAVRMFTVHGSKGLEFESVFIPNMKKGGFPSRGKTDKGISLPKIIREKVEGYEQDEEECLFFVATSRAKGQLNFSHTDRNRGGKSVPESPFMEMIRSEVEPEPQASKASTEFTSFEGEGIDKSSMHFKWLTDHRKCPRQFFYKRVIEADAKPLISAYQRYHRALYGAVDELKRNFKPKDLEAKAALEVLEQFFVKYEIDSQPNAKPYRRNATRIIETFCETFSKFEGEFRTTSLTCKLDNGQVFFFPDVLIVNDQTAYLFKVSFRPKPKEVKPDYLGDEIFLMADTVSTDLNLNLARTAAVFLPSMEIHDFEATNKLVSNRKKNAVETIELIRQGYFQAEPDPDKCKKCPYFIPCPS
jgi:superfamily I DNA/RNA helicase